MIDTSYLMYGILDASGRLILAGASLSSVMREMALRWAGKAIQIPSNVVLFDIDVDRLPSDRVMNKAAKAQEFDLAVSRVLN